MPGMQFLLFLVFHNPVNEFRIAAQNAGYEDSANEEKLYRIGIDVPAVNNDFGTKGENFKGKHEEPCLMEILEKFAFDGVFAAHSHLCNTSVLHVRVEIEYV